MKKNILITGVSRGLGYEISLIALENGYNVYGISRNINENINLLKNGYNNFFYLTFDQNFPENVKEEIFTNFIPNSIKLDAYINNAAIAYDDIVTNLNIQKLEEMFRINVFTPMNIVKYSIRNMLFNNNYGSIVHISSISVHTGYKGLSMYAASKGALEAFSKNTSREWGERVIRSNCVVAGFMRTDMSSSLSDEQMSRIYKRTSLKKVIDIKSVAETVLYLISDKAKSITGQNIFVDNGTI